MTVKPLKWKDDTYGNGSVGRNGRHICARVTSYNDRTNRFHWYISLGNAYMNMATGTALTKDEAQFQAEQALGQAVLEKFFIM